tara:strand:- start:187 stop:453 length:267 start_codon:yes stop_codon:yes gene_type:complete
MFICGIKKLTGIDCPGCGIQRSFLKLIHGEFLESLELFPALLPLLILVLYTILHLKFMFKNGHKVILGLFCSTVGLTIFNFTYKLISS